MAIHRRRSGDDQAGSGARGAEAERESGGETAAGIIGRVAEGEMKICKDCKHAKRKWLAGWEYAKCERRPPTTNLVTGKQTSAALYCSTEREYSCGTHAEYFEPKPESGFFAAFRKG